MPKQRRIALPRILDVLRLDAESHLSERAIAHSLSLSPSTVGNILSRAKNVGISWPVPSHLDERKLETMLFPKAAGRPKKRTEPDLNHLFQESKRKGVTLQLLWLEYKNEHPEGYQYSQFCERFNPVEEDAAALAAARTPGRRKAFLSTTQGRQCL